MKNIKLLAKTLLVGALSFGAISCSSSTDGGGNKPNPNPIPQSSRLQVGNIGAIPTNAEALGAAYPLVIYNNTTAAVNITSVKATGVDPRLDIKSDSQLFDYSGCKAGIPSGGSCSINVKASALKVNGIGDNGQYGIAIDGISSKGTAYHEDQIVSYQNFVSKTATGAHFNVSGAATTNIIKATQMGVTVPVYFDKAYTNVKVDGGAVDATLLGCGLIQPNGTYNISANSNCSVYVNFRGGKTISTTVSLLANYNAPVKASKSAKNAKSGTGKSLKAGGTPIMSFGMLNSTQAAAYMTSGLVTSSLPSDGTTTQTITFVNNGMSEATGISMSVLDPVNLPNGSALSNTVNIGSSTLTVTANTCTAQAGGSGTGSVAAAGSCAVTFTMTGTQQASTVQMLMGYSTGLGLATASYSTYYYPVNFVAGLSSSASPSATEFLNTAVSGNTKTIIVTVTNTSTTTAITLGALSGGDQGILVTNGNPGVPSGMTVSANTCTANLSLAAQATCAYTVTFDPTVATTGQIDNLFGLIRGTYSSQGTTYNVSTALNMPYSSNDPTDLIFNPTALQFTTNVSQPVNVPLSITNQNGLGSGTITNISINFASISLNDTSVLSQSPSGCLASLPYNATCNVVLQFAPTAAESSNGYQDMTVTYTGGQYPNDAIATSFEAIAGNTNIQVTNVIANNVGSPPVGYTGAGTSGSPYTFYNYGGSFGVQITYTNQGTVAADNFSIDGATIPSASNGWALDTANTTCGSGSSPTTLAAGGTCVVAFTAVNANYVGGLTYSSTMDFDFPNAVYFESGQQLVKNVWDYNSSSGVNVQANAILSPEFTISSGVIESIGGVSYYVYPVAIANNANAGQTAPVNVAIDLAQYSIGSSNLAIFSSSNTALTSVGNSFNLAGGATSAATYLWIPTTTTTPPYTTINAKWTYASMQPTNDGTSPNQVAVGVFYNATAGSNTITANWSQLSYNGQPTTYSVLGTPTINGATVPSGNVIDLQQYQGYLYAATTTGVYSYTVSPWVDNSGTFIPESTANTGSGALTAAGGGNSQVDASITAPGAFAINSVAGTTYALTTQSGTLTSWIYDLSTVVNGVFNNTTGAFSGLIASDAIFSVAISDAGNIYLTATGNTVYYCGTVTAVAACQALSLPAGMTSAASNTTLSYLTVSAIGGNIAVTQYVTDPNATGNFTPTTRYIYAADAAASTALSGANVNTIGTFITGLPFTYFFNLDAAATATPLFGLSGQIVNSGSNPSYNHSNVTAGYAANLGTATYNAAQAYNSGNSSYYSFLSLNGQN